MNAPRGRTSRRPSWRLASTARRIRVLLVVVAVLLSVAGGRALQLQVLEASDKAEEVAAKLNQTRKLVPLRGQILDRDGQVLAFSESTVDLVAYPNMIAGKGTDVLKASAKDLADGARIPAAMAPVIAR